MKDVLLTAVHYGASTEGNGIKGFSVTAAVEDVDLCMPRGIEQSIVLVVVSLLYVQSGR